MITPISFNIKQQKIKWFQSMQYIYSICGTTKLHNLYRLDKKKEKMEQFIRADRNMTCKYEVSNRT